jgi:hypothetical protein
MGLGGKLFTFLSLFSFSCCLLPFPRRGSSLDEEVGDISDITNLGVTTASERGIASRYKAVDKPNS